MPTYGFWASAGTLTEERRPTVGHPKRDRVKVKAGRKAAKRR